MKMPTRTLRLTLFLLIIKNIYEFVSREKRKLFKNFLPKFLLLPKKTELPKIWGGCSPPPPAPPAHTPMSLSPSVGLCQPKKILLEEREINSMPHM